MKCDIRNLLVAQAASATALFSRSIGKVVPATPNGPSFRLVGTVDIDGKGTPHPLGEVGPFFLLEAATIPRPASTSTTPIPALPTAGVHPHRGHSFVTLLFEGRSKSWDSFSEKETIITGPSSYWVDAGRGLFHEERNFYEQSTVRVWQLWVAVREEDRHNAPRVQYAPDRPVEDILNADNVVIGKIVQFVGKSTPLETPHPVEVAWVKQDANTVYQHPIDPTHKGFIVLMSGRGGSFGGTFPENTYDILVLDDVTPSDGTEASFLSVEASDEPLEYLVCVGEPTGETWCKKAIGRGGAVVAVTTDETRAFATDAETYYAAGKDGGSFAPWGVERQLDQTSK